MWHFLPLRVSPASAKRWRTSCLAQGRKQSSDGQKGSQEAASIHSEGPALKILLIQRVNLALHLAVEVDMHPLWSFC